MENSFDFVTSKPPLQDNTVSFQLGLHTFYELTMSAVSNISVFSTSSFGDVTARSYKKDLPFSIDTFGILSSYHSRVLLLALLMDIKQIKGALIRIFGANH